MEYAKGAAHYAVRGIGLISGLYNIFVIAWVLPTIQTSRLYPVTTRLLISAIIMNMIQAIYSITVMV